ncbi:MAG: hypothetical protein WBM01_26365 [Mycobacterium sp.]|jgi:hypothetical protein|uniref:hypothetical protein n=1 Tax=Mycobacterium sp. TaxID=1785 RepID=UPI003C779010
MFEIKMVDGQEIRETKGDTFSLNPNTGVLTISRANGFEETSMHYSPAAWSSVKHTIQRSLVPAAG